MTKPILVATDGREAARGAVQLGAALAARTGAAVRAVAVIRPPFALVATSLDQLLHPLAADPRRVDAVRRAVLSQFEAAEGAAAAMLLDTVVGEPARAIASRAAQVDAGLIVVGRSRDGLRGWWGAGETSLRITHLAHVPVLTVPPAAAVLPRRAVVAVDFSEFSLRAASDAAEWVAETGTIHLVHVAWATADPDWNRERTWEETYRAGAAARLEEVALQLAASTGVRVVTTVATGEPATEILRLADRVGADLIAAGSHGFGYFGRLVMGSISTQLLRRAECAVLITPPPPAAGGEAHPEHGQGAVLGGDPFPLTATPRHPAAPPSAAPEAKP